MGKEDIERSAALRCDGCKHARYVVTIANGRWASDNTERRYPVFICQTCDFAKPFEIPNVKLADRFVEGMKWLRENY